MPKVAVIGSGISGLTCAYVLRKHHQVTLFEANDYIGGHTHTHQVVVDDEEINVDTGFIVYNDRTYPNFIRLLNELKCSGVATEMSFSLRDDTSQIEYNGHNLDTLFAQRSNLLRPSFWQMIRDILRFNKLAKTNSIDQNTTLDELMVQHDFSEVFKTRYLFPMAAAIWSTGDKAIGEFPAQSLIDFFVNHGLVDLKNRPQWYVVKGGSHSYVKAMLPHLEDVRTSSSVTQVSRVDNKVTVFTQDGAHQFDEVIFACHSDEALALLTEPSPLEDEVLGKMKYTPNTAYLHTDESRLPKRPKAWASWNYLIPRGETADQARLTYNMNILQHLKTKTQVLVTLNDDKIDDSKIIGRYEYSHPYYDQGMLEAQNRYGEISNQNHTHYCGAYWYYGFHEDGVKSALRVCEELGVAW